MRPFHTFIALTIVLALSISCSGGGASGFIVGEIQGITSPTDDLFYTYKVEVTDTTGGLTFSYLWTLNPSTAGTINNPYSTSPLIGFYDVVVDTNATITVTITSSANETVVNRLDIVIRDSGF